MPKRMFNGDKAWKSDKLRQLPDRYVAEYAWMYSVALADGTFEAAPERILSDAYSYSRKGWTIKKLCKVLSEFEKVGLLQRKKDSEGKVWGFWVGSDSELPPESERHKYKQGKRYLFEMPEKTPESIESNIESASGGTRNLIEDGFGLGLGMNRIGSEADNQPRAKGQYKKGEFTYLNRRPEKVYNIFVEIWFEIVGPGAMCKKPFKRGWDWFADTCAAVEIDTLVPAFELWARDNADPSKETPISDFLRELGTYTQKLAKPFARRTVAVDPNIELARKRAIDRDIAEAKERNANALYKPEPRGETVEELFVRLAQTGSQLEN